MSALVAATLRERYRKSEHAVAMRDGVRLYTVVYSPLGRSRPLPILLTRTPYGAGPYGDDAVHDPIALAPSSAFIESGYFFVVQDGRGAHRSEGEWQDLRPPRTEPIDPNAVDETTDAWDTVAWLVDNLDGNNGRVGLWGHSYAGWYTVMALLDLHPAVQAVSPQSTTADAFVGDDNHQNGAFFLMGSLAWASKTPIVTGGLDRGKKIRTWPDRFPYGASSAYEFFLQAGPTSELDDRYFDGHLMKGWDDLIAHPDYDEYWQRRNVLDRLQAVTVPVLSVASWFDGPDPYGAIATFKAIEQGGGALAENVLIAGPWRHGGQLTSDGSGLGDLEFGSGTAETYRNDMVFPFFEQHLKGVPGWSPRSAITFETGSNRWRRFDSWPPVGVVALSLYFGPDGGLGLEAPTDTHDAFDSYVSDPSNPVPFLEEPLSSRSSEYMVADQRYASKRPDVLVFETGPLDEDLTIAGSMVANLWVSTTGTDSDWFVKVIDVYPEAPANAKDMAEVGMGGYQALIVASVMRAKYRASLSHPQAMTPGLQTPISFPLWDRLHTFRRGHRLMVQVHSSWFPLFDRNPQVFTDIYHAQAHEYMQAGQSVFRGPDAPSHIVLPVLVAR